MESRTSEGNWLALVGVVLYLLEFAVFIPAEVSIPAPPNADPVAHYAGRETAYAFTAVMLSLLLMGRVAFVAGLRAVLPPALPMRPLADLALAAMTVSVALEVAGLGAAAAAAGLATRGADAAVVTGADAVIGGVSYGVLPTFGLSVLLASIAMLISGLFRSWLGWLGVVSGLVWIGAVSGMALFYAGDPLTAAENPFAQVWPLAWMGAVVWMLSTGIVLFRRWRRS